MFSSAKFWEKNGFPQSMDEEYVLLHELHTGVLDTLDVLSRRYELFVLSNDVSEWSALLRRRFALEKHFKGWVISGDVKVRKPDPRIYEIALERTSCLPGECLFIDDNVANLEAAREKGMRVAWFKDTSEVSTAGLQLIRDFPSVRTLLEGG
jgi:putative hydrolase of the HAD superfamily